VFVSVKPGFIFQMVVITTILEMKQGVADWNHSVVAAVGLI
jgi:hypothetical protein